MYEGKIVNTCLLCELQLTFQGKLGKHTVGMAYRQGYLKVTPEVRSIPLGAKRKRGRPKKVGHCLQRSPVLEAPVDQSLNPLPIPDFSLFEEPVDVQVGPCKSSDVAISDDSVGPPVRMKRKRGQDKEQMSKSPIDVLLCQAQMLKPGLGAPKPPKKKKRLQGSNEPITQGNNEPITEPTSPKLPPAITCKKGKNKCSHQIVFGKHYDKSLWAKYAEHINAKESSVVIDPSYFP